MRPIRKCNLLFYCFIAILIVPSGLLDKLWANLKTDIREYTCTQRRKQSEKGGRDREIDSTDREKIEGMKERGRYHCKKNNLTNKERQERDERAM